MLTNAGVDDRLPPAIRVELEKQLANQGLLQDEEEKGRAMARVGQRGRSHNTVVPLAAQQPMVVDGVSYVDMVPDFELLEPEYDETVPILLGVGQPVECSWWPFKPKGATTAVRRRFGPKAWEVLIDGVYCLRCRHRHASPNPGECANCYLTAAHREKALRYLERVASVMRGEGVVHVEGQSREQRRSLQRQNRRTGSGIALPPGVRV